MGIKKIVIMPHAGDECFLAAGVIRQAVIEGFSIKVVILCREHSALSTKCLTAMAALELPEQDVIFLQEANGTALKRSIQKLLTEFLPEEIYTTSPWDIHSDYSEWFYTVQAALAAVCEKNAAYCPTLWGSVLHAPKEDAIPPKNTIASFSSYGAEASIAFFVPEEMRCAEPEQNLKYQALLCYDAAINQNVFSACKKLLAGANATERFYKHSVRRTKRLLFIGDSITDGGRTYAGAAPWGYGFVSKVQKYLQCFYPYQGYEVLNRGVSGNKAVDLAQRWPQDCLALQPEVITLMVGINDCGRRYDENYPTTAQAFEQTLRSLLSETRQTLPAARVVLMEPYLTDALPQQRVWREDLDLKRLVVQRLALEFQCNFIPLDGIFAAACARNAPSYWAADGVHPTDAGSSLIALAWLNAVGFNKEALL